MKTLSSQQRSANSSPESYQLDSPTSGSNENPSTNAELLELRIHLAAQDKKLDSLMNLVSSLVSSAYLIRQWLTQYHLFHWLIRTRKLRILQLRI